MAHRSEAQLAPVGVFDSAKRLAGSLVAHLHTRLALFSTEFAEEKLRLTTLLYSTALVLFLLFATVILALLFVIGVYWDTAYRLHAIGGLAIVCLIGTAIAWHAVQTQLRKRPRLFEASLNELYRDRQQLETS